MLLVTHSLALVERFCDEALWIDGGLARAHGDPRRVVGAYITDVEKSEERALAAADAKAQEHAETEPVRRPASPILSLPPRRQTMASGRRRAGGALERWRLPGSALIGEDGQPGHVFHSGEAVTIELSVTARHRVTDFAFGIGLFSADGVCCYGTNTDVADLQVGRVVGQRHRAIRDREP